MGIDEIFAYAAQKVVDLKTEVSRLSERVNEINQEAARWERLCSVAPTPFDEAVPA